MNLIQGDVMRQEIEVFANECEKLMAKNDGKKGDSWKHLTVRELLDMADGELEELRFELDNMNTEEIQRILANLGNYAMMVWTRLEELKPNETIQG